MRPFDIWERKTRDLGMKYMAKIEGALKAAAVHGIDDAVTLEAVRKDIAEYNRRLDEAHEEFEASRAA